MFISHVKSTNGVLYLEVSGVLFCCFYSPPACFVYPVFLHTSANIEEHDDEAERFGWREGHLWCEPRSR